MAIAYEDIKALIAGNGDLVQFAEFGDGVSDDWLDRAEAALEIGLPESYKWWLRNYGGGEIGGEEIFSIYEEEFDSVVGGDIVFMHRLNQSNELLKPTQLAICESDIDGVFYFDTSEGLKDGEYPIMSSITEKVYANDFLDFLKKRIEIFKQ